MACVQTGMMKTVTHHVSLCSSLRTGKCNSFGWLRYSGFARHKDPKLDAAGALADLLVFSLNLTGLNILDKIESQDSSWQVTCTRKMADCLSGFTALFRKKQYCVAMHVISAGGITD